jgi:hypothetical protein
MGTRTPNMSVYKPAPGEQVYDPAFSAGLDNIDAHDHSGAPNKGIPIGTAGIQDGAITPDKLSTEILAEATAQTTNASPTQATSISVAESQSVTISGRFVALRDDATEAVGGNFEGTFHRPTGGSVQTVGFPFVSVNDNSSGNPYFQLVPVTGVGNEFVSLRCVGETGKTIDWHIVYNVVAQPEI